MPTSQTNAFRLRVRDLLDEPPVLAPPGTTCAQAVAWLRERGGSAIVTLDGEGRPDGILTERDVARRLAFATAPETPVHGQASRPLLTIAADDLLFRAIGRMRHAGLRHMPALEPDGRIAGMVYLHRAQAAATAAQHDWIDRLTREGDLDGLAAAKAEQLEVAALMLADGTPAAEVLALISHLNNDAYRHAAALCLEAMRADGLGEAPRPWCLLVMGSGGRGESFLDPDQDNGLIVGDYPDEEHDRIDGWFRDFAGRLCDAMAEVGLPLCRGYVMAVNPLWRKTESQWTAQIDLWLRRRHPIALRLTDIFFDFFGVAGEQAYAAALRRYVADRLRGATTLLQDLYRNDEAYGVGLGWFDRFIVEKNIPEHRGKLNLKFSAALPLVEAVRLYALREGVTETATLARIAALRDRGVLDAAEADALGGAFEVIALTKLERQIADLRTGTKASSYVHPSFLSRRRRDELVAGLKAIRRLRDRLRSDLTGELF